MDMGHDRDRVGFVRERLGIGGKLRIVVTLSLIAMSAVCGGAVWDAYSVKVLSGSLFDDGLVWLRRVDTVAVTLERQRRLVADGPFDGPRRAAMADEFVQLALQIERDIVIELAAAPADALPDAKGLDAAHEAPSGVSQPCGCVIC